jgi:hypothetical protein
MCGTKAHISNKKKCHSIPLYNILCRKLTNKILSPALNVKLCFSLILLALLNSVSAAQIGNESTFGFLNIPGSARTSALGGDHVSLDRGSASLFTTNPAYLNESTHKELYISYINHISDIYLGMAGYSWHMDNIGTFASGIRFVNYGDFTRTNSDGEIQGDFSSYDFSWNSAYSRALYENLQAGIGIQLIASSYDTYRSTALALFGGLQYRFNDDFTNVGLSFQHLGSQLTTFDGTREQLPFNLSGGITHRLQHLPLRFNLTLHSLNRWEIPVFDDEEPPGFSENLFRRARFGIEILFSENFHFRMGYDRLKNEELKTDRRIDLSGTGIGLGIVIRNIHFDISRTSYSETGGLLQLNLSTRF